MHAFFFFFLLQEILDDCISNCNCDKNDYNPICLEEIGLNFYSACAAGCSEFRIDEVTNAVSYGGCQCLHQHTNDTLYYGHPSKEVKSILLALDPRGPSQSSESNNFIMLMPFGQSTAFFWIACCSKILSFCLLQDLQKKNT